jgi:hypothetical protein
MASRDVLKAPSSKTESQEAAWEPVSQKKRPEAGRYRLLVDRQLKGSFASSEEARTAGLAIKVKYPIVSVVVYDAFEGINTAIESLAT